MSGILKIYPCTDKILPMRSPRPAPYNRDGEVVGTTRRATQFTRGIIAGATIRLFAKFSISKCN